jgi:flagellar motor switch protein FliM
MADILSQQEIDNLLSGIGKKEEPTAEVVREDRGGQEIALFDFRLPHSFSERQIQTFYAVHETFAESFGTYLISRLQTTVSIKITSVDQIFYSEYIAATSKPSCFYVFQVGGSEAKGVVEMSPSLVLAFIARLLGGTTEGHVKPRLLTRIEQNIIKGVVLRAISELEKAWATLSESKFSFERYESEGDFVQIAPRSEIVLVVLFELTIGDQQYPMSFCFRTFAMDDVLSKLNMQNCTNISGRSSGTQRSGAILRKLEATKIPAVCVLGESTLTMQQLMGLEPGDVLLTNTIVTNELKILIAGKTRAYGKPGVSNGKTAVRITHIVSDTDNKE